MDAATVDDGADPIERLRVFSELLLVALSGLLLGSLLYSLLVSIAADLGLVGLTAEGQVDTSLTLQFTAVIVFSGIGLLLTTLGYLHFSGKDGTFIDLDTPELRDIGYILAGTVGLFVLLTTISVVYQQLGIPSAPSGIEQRVRDAGETDALLALAPLSILIIGPGEELVYRNIIQKRLYDLFPRLQSILLASVIFAAVHLLQYQSADPLQTASSLFVVFVLALVLGGLYERTGKLVVPAVVHGLFNAIQFLLLYAEIAYNL